MIDEYRSIKILKQIVLRTFTRCFWFGLISCGIFSLPIHIPQCQKKWLAEEERKPKKERRPLPPPPATEQPIKTTGAQMVDDFNNE